MTNLDDRGYWDRRAAQYGCDSVGYGCSPRRVRYDNWLRQRAIDCLLPISPGMEALDVGTGTGKWAIKFAKAGASVVGVGISSVMLEMAQDQAEVAGVEVKWINTGLEDLQLPTRSFDAVTSVTCFQHITDEDRFLAAVHNVVRVTKPGGTIVVLEDTPIQSHCVADRSSHTYIHMRTQEEWKAVFESSGVNLVDWVGVSFLRLRFHRLLDPVCVLVDTLLQYIPGFRSGAPVTAFAFRVPQC